MRLRSSVARSEILRPVADLGGAKLIEADLSSANLKGAITVENPLRDHRVRWGAVTKVDAVHALRVQCAAAPGASQGKILHSWAVQSSPRSAQAAQLRRSRGGTAAGPRGGPAAPGRLWPPPGAVPDGPAADRRRVRRAAA